MGRTVTKAERHRLIRTLIGQGKDLTVIRRGLTSGIELADGRTCRVGATTAARDMAEIAAEIGALIEDDDMIRIEVAAAFSRIKANGIAAAGKGQFGTAIYADRVLLDFAARARPDRYERATGRQVDQHHQGPADTDDRHAELRAMSIDDLDAERERLGHVVAAFGDDLAEELEGDVDHDDG